MEEMIAAEPSLVGPILNAKADAKGIAELVKAAADRRSTIVVTGCGTSETAAMAITDLLGDALKRSGISAPLVHSRQALEASLEPWPGGVCIGISHEGSTRATILAMEVARTAGAATALITARRQSSGATAADAVFTTPLVDRSWCHTVGYLSPMLAGAAIAEAIAPSQLDVAALPSDLAAVLASTEQADALARAIYGVDRLIITAGGHDRSPARELALKIEEGVRLPSRFLELETVLHGHLAAADMRTGLVLVATDAGERLMTRTGMLLDAARAIGLRLGAIVSGEVDQRFASRTDLPRVVLPKQLAHRGLIGRFAGAALGLQQLTVALTRLARTNPDLIRRDQQPYRDAARAAESSAGW